MSARTSVDVAEIHLCPVRKQVAHRLDPTTVDRRHEGGRARGAILDVDELAGASGVRREAEALQTSATAATNTRTMRFTVPPSGASDPIGI